MPSKQAILDNVAMYNADELLDYIKFGIVSFDELCDDTDGEFPVKVRKEVEQKLAGLEDSDWENCRSKNTISVYEKYLKSYPTGKYRETARTMILQLQQVEQQNLRSNEWADVNKDSIEELRTYCEAHPNDLYFSEARKLINRLRREQFMGIDKDALVSKIKNIQTDRSVLSPDDEIYNVITDYIDRGKIKQNDLLNMIKEDNNILRASIVMNLLDHEYLDYDDFDKIGISDLFIRHMVNGEKSQSFSIPEKLEKINKTSSEIYFWGIPSSGKSCALGAILSVASSGRVAKSMKKDNDCQGYSYMTRLAELFKTDGSVGTLPEGTSIYSTYEMGFDLEDEDNKVHPITCVDLAGELVRCMFKSDAREQMTDDEMEALDTLTRVLIDNRTQNRKIHFFVMEYGADDRKYEGLTQQVYLDGALRYIERTGIFKKETDAIYLMITKVDKAGVKGAKLQEVLKTYIRDNYGGFYNGLVKICNDCEINNGNVEVVPFSLGTVCFQDYCMFNEGPASNVVKKLLARTKGFKNDKLHIGLNIFKG